MIVEVRRDAGFYSVYVNGRRMVDRESFAVADHVAHCLRADVFDGSESAEVAESIRSYFEQSQESSNAR